MPNFVSIPTISVDLLPTQKYTRNTVIDIGCVEYVSDDMPLDYMDIIHSVYLSGSTIIEWADHDNSLIKVYKVNLGDKILIKQSSEFVYPSEGGGYSAAIFTTDYPAIKVSGTVVLDASLNYQEILWDAFSDGYLSCWCRDGDSGYRSTGAYEYSEIPDPIIEQNYLGVDVKTTSSQIGSKTQIHTSKDKNLYTSYVYDDIKKKIDTESVYVDSTSSYCSSCGFHLEDYNKQKNWTCPQCNFNNNSWRYGTPPNEEGVEVLSDTNYVWVTMIDVDFLPDRLIERRIKINKEKIISYEWYCNGGEYVKDPLVYFTNKFHQLQTYKPSQLKAKSKVILSDGKEICTPYSGLECMLKFGISS